MIFQGHASETRRGASAAKSLQLAAHKFGLFFFFLVAVSQVLGGLRMGLSPQQVGKCCAGGGLEMEATEGGNW